MSEPAEDPVCVDVIKAIADVEGTSPNSLELTLNEHIQTDALELLSSAERGPWELSFAVPNHEITVRGDRTIVIDGQVIRGTQ